MTRTTITLTADSGFVRGDYIALQSDHGPSDLRIIGIDGATLTTRHVGPAWYEAIASRIEDWFLFPLADFFDLLKAHAPWSADANP